MILLKFNFICHGTVYEQNFFQMLSECISLMTSDLKEEVNFLFDSAWESKRGNYFQAQNKNLEITQESFSSRLYLAKIIQQDSNSSGEARLSSTLDTLGLSKIFHRFQLTEQ